MELYKARVTLEVLVDGHDPEEAKQRIHDAIHWAFASEITVDDFAVDYPERIER